VELKNVSFSNCVKLLLVSLSQEKRSVEFLRSRYLESGTVFEVTLLFLERLKILGRSGDVLWISARPGGLIDPSNDKRIFAKRCRDIIVERLVLEEDGGSDVRNYLQRFSLKSGTLRFSPSLEQRIAEADLRNLLIELDVIEYDAAEDDYILTDQTVASHCLLSPSYEIPKDSFVRLLKERQDIGEGAELAVLDHERKRLKDFPGLRDNIKHTAVENVGAGYDISSFEGPGHPTPEKDRLIEVKAVSALTPTRFFWTINEIDSARKARETYYLYLVPVRGRGEYFVHEMLVIRDPYAQVYSDEDKWQRIPQSYQFQLTV